jgi:hypothetical protein
MSKDVLSLAKKSRHKTHMLKLDKKYLFLEQYINIDLKNSSCSQSRGYAIGFHLTFAGCDDHSFPSFEGFYRCFSFNKKNFGGDSVVISSTCSYARAFFCGVTNVKYVDMYYF